MPAPVNWASDIDFTGASFSLPVADLRGSARRRAKKTKGANQDDAAAGRAGRQVPARGQADLPLRRPGAGAAADAAAPTRPRRWPQHRRLHLGLPRLAARHVRPHAVARQIVPAGAGYRLRSRPERGSGGDRGVGQPAGRAVSRRQGRWRVRHLVRQGTGRRPLGRRAEACQFGRHLAAWRRAGACRRRSWLPILDTRAPERTGVRGGADADHQSGDACRTISTSASRLCAVALFRLLGRLQGDRRDGREFGVHLQRSIARARS